MRNLIRSTVAAFSAIFSAVFGSLALAAADLMLSSWMQNMTGLNLDVFSG
jgi:hypothetical protein